MLPGFTGRAFLAPMAGVSDPALRLQCRRYGAGLVVTEFTSIHGIVAQEERLRRDGRTIQEFIRFSEEERPLSVQLFGSDLETLGRAASIVEPYFDMIDYNMGCPAPHITSQMAGGALLQEPDLTRDILRMLVQTVSKPVTLKIRAGVTDSGRRLFHDIAGTAEDEGIQMITLHPRTVSQGYSGRADWSLIRELKETSGIPIVGNGDISTPEDARMMLDETGCDYVMVGRGAMGNPFIFEQINDYLRTGSYREYSHMDRLDSFLEYMGMAPAYDIRFSNVRSQAMRFVRGMRGAANMRSRITLARTMDDLRRVMNDARHDMASYG